MFIMAAGRCRRRQARSAERFVWPSSSAPHLEVSWVVSQPLRWLQLVHTHRATRTWAPNFAPLVWTQSRMLRHTHPHNGCNQSVCHSSEEGSQYLHRAARCSEQANMFRGIGPRESEENAASLQSSGSSWWQMLCGRKRRKLRWTFPAVGIG